MRFKHVLFFLILTSKVILILGSIGLDTIQTQYSERSELLGGSATYAAIAAGLFSPVHLVGIVGTDFPEPAHKLLLKYTANSKDLIIGNISRTTADIKRTHQHQNSQIHQKLRPIVHLILLFVICHGQSLPQRSGRPQIILSKASGFGKWFIYLMEDPKNKWS